jgi:signal transduction histidine kinase
VHARSEGPVGGRHTLPEDERSILLCDVAAERRQRRAAFQVAWILCAVSLLPLWFAAVHLPANIAFVVIVAAVTCVIDLITASLLFAQVLIQRSQALTALARGYLLSGLLMVPFVLTFPGAFAPDGLLGAGVQTTVWLFMVWHVVPPASVIAYAALKQPERPSARSARSLRRVVLGSVLAFAAAVTGLTWCLTTQHRWLPHLMVDEIRVADSWHYVIALISVLDVAAFAMLWRRRGSVLDLWLLVQSWSWLLESLLLNFTTGRFDLGYYAARVFWVSSSSLVLLVLIAQLGALNMRVVLSNMAQRRSRDERLASLEAFSAAMAHQLRQPLAAIQWNNDAAINWLTAAPPNEAELRSCLERVGGSVERAAAAIEAVLSLFKRAPGLQTEVFDLNALVRDVLAMLERDTGALQISVRLHFDSRLSLVRADRSQLTQVLLNLVNNAAEAMSEVVDRPRVLTIATEATGATGVMVSVGDSGPGVDPELREQIFEVFRTSKRGGLGMGLAICRSIVEDHGGRLGLAARPGEEGAVFEFSLPLALQGARQHGEM